MKLYWKYILAIIAGFFALTLIAKENYLLFHILIELCSVVITFSLFTITWNMRRIMDNKYLLIVGVAFAFIAILDIFHIITFQGMNIFSESSHFSPQFWVFTRMLEACTLLTSFIFLSSAKKPSANAIVIIYSIITTAIIFLILKTSVVPPMFITGQGQTVYKIWSEFLIIAVLLAALVMLYKSRTHFTKEIYNLIFASIIFAVISEACFTLYFSNYDIINQIGHFAKLITFLCIYKANVKEVFIRPADTLFTTINESEKKYKELSQTLYESNKSYHELNEKLVASEKELIELNKTKDKFLSIISHDLRNMFTPILSYSALLKGNIEKMDIERSKAYAGDVETASKQVYSLFENLLNWSKSQLGAFLPKPEAIHSGYFIDEMNEYTRQLCKMKSIDFKTTADDCSVYADKEMIHTLLRNLIGNALKFTHFGGSINLSILKTGENNVLFEVADNGVGISEEHLGEIFSLQNTLITQGTANEKGTGLGLILCADFIQKNNGKIWAESTQGEGSRFKFILPAA